MGRLSSALLRQPKIPPECLVYANQSAAKFLQSTEIFRLREVSMKNMSKHILLSVLPDFMRVLRAW